MAKNAKDPVAAKRGGKTSKNSAKPLSPGLAIAQWVAAKFGPPGTEPCKVSIRESRAVMKKADRGEIAAMNRTNLALACSLFAGYDLSWLHPKRAFATWVDGCGDSFLMDSVDFADERMNAEERLQDICKSADPNGELHRRLLSYSDAIFSQGGIVVVGIEIGARVAKGGPLFFASLFGKFSKHPEPKADDSLLRQVRDVAWIALYRGTRGTMVMDPERKAGPCFLDDWIAENDFGFDCIDTCASGFANVLAILGVGRPERKAKPSAGARRRTR